MNGESAPKFSELEALLFYYGEAISVKRIAHLLEIKPEECEQLLQGFAGTLAADPMRGLTLIRQGDAVQLATKPELKTIGEKILKDELREQLTPAALEVLALVAYLGPMPRSTVDYIRGVNSSFTLRNLMVRGLIERDMGREKGNVHQYRASFAFLNHMGLVKLEDLPEYPHFREILERFEAQAIEAQTVEASGAAPAPIPKGPEVSPTP